MLLDGEHLHGRVCGTVAPHDRHDLVIEPQLARQSQDPVGCDVSTRGQPLADLADEPAAVERRPVAGDALRAEDRRRQHVSVDRGRPRGAVQQAAYGVFVQAELGCLGAPPLA